VIQGEEAGNKEAKTETGEQKEGEQKDGENPTEENKEEFRYAKDLLVRVTDLKEGTSREHFKEFFAAIGTNVAYVDFSRGEPTAVIRLNDDSPLKATDATQKAKESAVELGGKPGKDLTYAVVTGEEEEKYWKELKSKHDQLKGRGQKRKGRDGGRGGRGRGGRGRGGRGRGGGKKKQRKQ